MTLIRSYQWSATTRVHTSDNESCFDQDAISAPNDRPLARLRRHKNTSLTSAVAGDVSLKSEVWQLAACNFHGQLTVSGATSSVCVGHGGKTNDGQDTFTCAKLAKKVNWSLSGEAPSYLADDIWSRKGSRVRSSTDRSCAVPRTHNTFGDRSFAVAGPRVWNSLPANLCDEDNHLDEF